VETHGPLGTIWVSLGLGAFYIALIWINGILLPMLTVPLFSLVGLKLLRKSPKPPAA
jgi:hypothetical protein